MLVPHGAGKSRAVGISARAARWLAGCVAVLGVGGAAFTYATASKALNLIRLSQLEEINALLAEEIQVTRTRLGELGDTLDAIGDRDRQVRLLAGLEPTDPDVQQAGIGGPVGTWTARDRLLAEGPVGETAIQTRLDLGTVLRRANLLAASFQEAAESLAVHNDRLTRTPSIMPTSGFLTSRFAYARIHPLYHEARAHEGIDVAAPMDTPILASAGGRVVAVHDNLVGYGRIVTIDHGYGIVTRYAHCSMILVRVGQRVARGQEIALVGNSGIATAPHLHYEVIVNGRQVDPMDYVFPETIVD